MTTDLDTRLGRLDRDLALNARIDGVFDRENIAEDGLGRLRRRHVDEVKRDTVGDIFRWPADAPVGGSPTKRPEPSMTVD
jgi:hypothetical protein